MYCCPVNVACGLALALASSPAPGQEGMVLGEYLGFCCLQTQRNYEQNISEQRKPQKVSAI